MPEGVFNKLRNTPADVHLSLAAEHLKAKEPMTWRSSTLPFSVPGHAVCFPSSDEPDAPPVCRFPFKSPDILYATAPVTAGACGGGAPSAAGHASLSTRPSSLNFDPVVLVPLSLSPGADGGRAQGYKLCPGTPISFLEADAVGKVRLEVDSKQLTLDPLVLRVAPPATPVETVPTPQ